MEIKAKVTEIYDWICDTPGREKHLYGGGGSGKSYAVAQYILLNRFLSGHKILVLRKTMPSLKMTVIPVLRDLVSEYNLPAKLNKADFTYTSKINKGMINLTGLDDPEKIKCFHPDTELLTKDGFKNVKDIQNGELIATMNPETNKFTYLPVSNTYEYNYNGDMYSPASVTNDRGSYVDFSVTEEHEIITHTRRRKQWTKTKAKDLFQTYFLPVSAKYNEGNLMDYFEIPMSKIQRGISFIKGRMPTKIPIISWLKFLGWFLSEGSCNHPNTYGVCISQTKPEGRKQLEADLKDFPYKPIVDDKAYNFYGKDLYHYLKQFGLCDKKFIPREILNLHPSLLKYLFDSLIAGDGYLHESGRMTYCSTSKQLIDDVSEIAIKLGYSVTVNPIDTRKLYACAKDAWVIYINDREEVRLENKKKTHYEGKVYCVEVKPYHTVFQRFHGKSCWIGQSGNFDTIWVEEATDLTLEDYRQLKLRLGRATDDAEIIFTYNPISAMHWLKTEVIDKIHPLFHKSNYKMNPYLSETFIKELESLIDQDLNYYNIYVLGEWGILENVIYPNWKLVDKMPEVDEIIYGIDFGYEAPNVLTAIGIKEKNAYIQELIYQKHMTNEEFIKKVDSLKLNKNSYFYADCAEPDRIIEFYNAGYNIIEANKDVLDGIDAVKRFNLFITKDSVNAIKEFGSYSRKKDRMGRVLEDPIKWNDHICDSTRYALHTHTLNGGVAELWAGL
jgi:PBSX family phage terminase large subunit